ncbi:MAG: hypothetical protein O4752_04370 [Trichodesmium sp. St4_bin8_1]|nr:hypothetical protein [Trichodesmium sp. St4_bin8_1]
MRHLHPRQCPPDQYPYLKNGKWPQLLYRKCSGTDPDKLGATPYLNTRYQYYNADGDIWETKISALCPLPRNEKPVCKPGHRMGYQYLEVPEYRRKGFYRPLDCAPNVTNDDSDDEPGEGEQESCPTVKVKVNGFPFQRVKVKRKKCS